MTEPLTVYVPAPGSRLREEVVRQGSGMVGSEMGDSGRIRVDFQDETDAFPTFADRVRRAAERHTWEGPDGREGYPTNACAYVSPDELVPVGRYDPEAKRVHVNDERALEEWLGVDDLAEEALSEG